MSNQLFANPNNWDTAELGDLISVIAGHGFRKSEYSTSGIKLLQIANVSFQEISWEETAYLPNEYIEHYPKLVLKPGDLVMALNRPILGRRVKFAILSQNDYPAILYQRVGKFIFKSKTIIRDFLYVFMQTDYFYHELKSRLAGSDQPYINPTELIKIRVPVPPLDEQKRIAAIAQKADRLRRTRRYALQLTDTYLQSVFLEMFGNPVTNPKRWDVLEIGDVCFKVTDGTHQPPPFTLSGIPFIFVQNMVGGEIDFSSTKYVSEATYQELTRNTKIEIGDILYSSVGSFGVAVQVLTKQKFIFQRHIAHLKPNAKKVNSSFLCIQMNSSYVYSQAKTAARGVAQPTVNLSEIREFKILVPPLPLQEKFAQIVQKFERIRTQQREGDRQAEHLFQTLLHRAFRGELTSQHTNDEPASVLLEQIGVEQAQAEAEAKAATQAMGDAAEYLGTKAKQQDTEPIQLTLPGIE
jgi:type I restriction enzyme S subunit